MELGEGEQDRSRQKVGRCRGPGAAASLVGSRKACEHKEAQGQIGKGQGPAVVELSFSSKQCILNKGNVNLEREEKYSFLRAKKKKKSFIMGKAQIHVQNTYSGLLY